MAVNLNSLSNSNIGKVAIITSTYNAERYIVECMNSVSSQTYPDIVHIIVDGKSTDKTQSLVRSSLTEKVIFHRGGFWNLLRMEQRNTTN